MMNSIGILIQLNYVYTITLPVVGGTKCWLSTACHTKIKKNMFCETIVKISANHFDNEKCTLSSLWEHYEFNDNSWMNNVNVSEGAHG